MILRTPPPKRQRSEARAPESPSMAGSDLPLVIYEDPPSAVPQAHLSSDEHLLCTYQCRQMVKSDFFDALSSAEKQVHEYESRLKTLDENFSNVEAERKRFLDQLLNAEQELAAAKGREQALQEQLLKEVNDFQERFKKQIHTQSELEVKFHNEMKLRLKAEASAASAEEKASILERKLSHLSESIEKEKKHFQQEIERLKRESRLSVSRVNADLERSECSANSAEKESELLKEQLEDLNKRFVECLHQKGEAEKKLSSLTFQEVPSADNNILVKHLQEELRNFESEVREARKLRASHENVELLREKLLEEKGRRERAEAEFSKLHEFEMNMKKLEDELSSWKLMMKEIPGVSCSGDIPVKFAALQNCLCRLF